MSTLLIQFALDEGDIDKALELLGKIAKARFNLAELYLTV